MKVYVVDTWGYDTTPDPRVFASIDSAKAALPHITWELNQGDWTEVKNTPLSHLEDRLVIFERELEGDPPQVARGEVS
jgi:hypothetical protein